MYALLMFFQNVREEWYKSQNFEFSVIYKYQKFCKKIKPETFHNLFENLEVAND